MTAFNEHAVTFRSGEQTLFGVLHEPEVSGDTAVVILVGGPQYRVGSHRLFVQIAREVARRGYPVLRFDFAGMGDSDGDFPGFEHLDRDVAAALGELCARYSSLRHVVLLGLCDGATAAAYYAPTDRRVSGAILLNPWVHTETARAKTYLWHYYPRRLLQADFWSALFRGDVAVLASIRDFLGKLWRVLPRRPRSGHTVAGNFIDRMCDSLGVFSGRVLVVASGRDFTASEFTELWNTDRRWQGIRKSADFVELDGADHTLSSRADTQKFCDAVCSWLKAGAASCTPSRRRA